MQINLKKLSALVPIVMLPLGAWLGYRTFRDYGLAEILDSVARIPTVNLALALMCAAASYACLTGFDALGVRYAGRRLPYRQIALTSFVSLAIGHNVGVSVLSSGALRYRFYSGFGLKATDVAKIILLSALTVATGLMTLSGLALAVRPDLGLDLVKLPPPLARGAGLLSLSLVALYLILAWRVRLPLRFHGHELRLPSVRIAAAQIVLSTVNYALVAATLYALLQGAAPYPEVIAAYVLGNLAGLLSHVPGGLGVLEYVIAAIVDHGHVIGALIAFRLVYYIIPLALGLLALAGAEIFRWHAKTAENTSA